LKLSWSVVFGVWCFGNAPSRRCDGKRNAETACLGERILQNTGVFEPSKRAFWLLALLLAGCATKAPPVADWRSEDCVAPVSSPPTNAPAAAVAVPKSQNAVVHTNRVVQTWVPLGRWCKENGLATPQRLGMTPPPSYVLPLGDGVLALQMGSRMAHWSGTSIWLGFAPQVLNGEPCVHALDLEKTVEPLACKEGFVKTNRTIVLDPGHGGTDSGTSSTLGGRYEKEFTLDWAQRLGRLLAARGWQVWLTRTNDVTLALQDRVAFAEAHQADLFVSLHFNSAAPDHEQVGLETYCLTPASMPSSVTRAYADELTLICPNNAFDAQNLQLALRVHRALLEVNGHHDRGVRRVRFPAVLRGQERPAILVEGGYLSNPREAQLIADPNYRQKLAEAVAGALAAQSQARSFPPKAGPAGVAKSQVQSPKSKIRETTVAAATQRKAAP
jgi:N-acetylmuramoyl-L-alanine amidase